MPTTDLPADLVELARVLLAQPWCPWRQPGGQLRDEHGVEWVYSDEADWNAGGSGDPLPDLSDPATLGALRALVSERVGGPVSIRWVGGRCWAMAGEYSWDEEAGGLTEAHAIIALGMAVTRG